MTTTTKRSGRERSDIHLRMISKAELLEAIRLGVADAVWRVATNATSMPSHDFYDSIQDGVRQAHERMGR